MLTDPQFSLLPSIDISQTIENRQPIFDAIKMSGYYFKTPLTSNKQEFSLNNHFQLPHSAQSQDTLVTFAPQVFDPLLNLQGPSYDYPEQLFSQSAALHPDQYGPSEQANQRRDPEMSYLEHHSQQVCPLPFTAFDEALNYDMETLPAAALAIPERSSSLRQESRTKIARAMSVAESIASSALSVQSDGSRGARSNAGEMARWGTPNEEDGSWSCAFPGCNSRARFNRGCDLRKHYKRHSKSVFCRHGGCPQAKEGGFSSKKDRARHEAKHNPTISCEHDSCRRMFSRQDNMNDHVRRVHKGRVT